MDKELKENLIKWCDEIYCEPLIRKDMIDIYRECSDDIFEMTFDFDELSWGEIMCNIYKDIPWAQWYSCVVDWDCPMNFGSKERFIEYMEKIYDRALEILNSN